MKIAAHKSSIKTINANHPAFVITDGVMIAPRAGFEIDKRCPSEYRMIIVECMQNGWIKPVANITEKELIFFGLSK